MIAFDRFDFRFDNETQTWTVRRIPQPPFEGRGRTRVEAMTDLFSKELEVAE